MYDAPSGAWTTPNVIGRFPIAALKSSPDHTPYLTQLRNPLIPILRLIRNANANIKWQYKY